MWSVTHKRNVFEKLDVQRKNVLNNVDISGLRAPWQNGPHKTNTQNDTKTRSTPWRDWHLEKKILLLEFYKKWILQEKLSYRLSTVNDFHWEFKPVFRYSKPHTYSPSIRDKNLNKYLYKNIYWINYMTILLSFERQSV